MNGLLATLTVTATLAAPAIYIHLGVRNMLRRRPPDAEVTPETYGLPYEPVTFKSRDHLTLRGWFIPADDPRGTIIICHGQSGSMDRDTAWAVPLHETGFHVLMFDFRGHGRSEGECVTLGYFERLDLLGALDHLAARGIECVGVIGLSMGGAVAISAAGESRNIAAVVSDSGYTSLRQVLVGALVERGWPPRAARPLAWLLVKYASWRTGAPLETCEPDRVVGIDFRCPLLVIQGDTDPYVPVAAVRAMIARSAGPVELWLVPRVGHREARERYPEEYRRRVVRFFAHWLDEGEGRRAGNDVNGP